GVILERLIPQFSSESRDRHEHQLSEVRSLSGAFNTYKSKQWNRIGPDVDAARATCWIVRCPVCHQEAMLLKPDQGILGCRFCRSNDPSADFSDQLIHENSVMPPTRFVTPKYYYYGDAGCCFAMPALLRDEVDADGWHIQMERFCLRCYKVHTL